MPPKLAAALALASAALLPALAVPARAAGDLEAGKAVFNRTCMACHSTEPGVNKIGPSLHGVVGREAGTVPGYNYSPAMKNFHKKWTPEELDKYLANPHEEVSGTKMAFAGLKQDQDRQNLIAYLETLK
jgi:cytochrome c